jgi:YD repeat-containing protein
MKSKNLILFSIGTALLLAACQKDKQPDTNNHISKVKTYSEKVVSSDGDSIVANYNLSYDAQNRITAINQVEVPGNKFSFTYESDSKFSIEIYVMGALSIHEDIFLNSNHFVDSTYQYNDEGDTTSEKYIYNANNQLGTVKEFNNSVVDNVTTYSYDGEGNLVKTTDTDKQVETFDYYPDLVFATPFINPLQSTTPAHLIKNHKITSNGYVVANIVSTYTFDSKNRISTITQTLDDGSVAIQTFTYF